MKPFSLLVKPASADCNLRCTYCFYLDRCQLYPNQKRHRMTDEVAEHMIRTFLATDQPVYAFGWQGGEPTLMGLDFFNRVVAWQERYGPDQAHVSNGLQTNGTMLDVSWARHIANYRFLVGVSLDGPEDVHNTSRVTIRGRGSHADVLRGIEALDAAGADYNILTLVSRANVGMPREIYHYLCARGILFHQYIECVEYDAQGRLQPFAVTGPEWGDFLCGIYDEWIKEDTRRVSVRLFDSIITKMVDGRANVCAMGTDCRQYLVVEHNGDVYPCDFFVEPALRLGNIMEDSWSDLLSSSAYEEFGARKRQWNEHCEHCAYLMYCNGCCPKNRFSRGSDPGKLSALCEGWKRFYAHALSGLERLANEIRQEQSRATVPTEAFSGVGRNDPCPCGSAKKFKKCCGR